MKTLKQTRIETNKVLIAKREEITKKYSMGLLTVSEYSKMLDFNLKMRQSSL